MAMRLKAETTVPPQPSGPTLKENRNATGRPGKRGGTLSLAPYSPKRANTLAEGVTGCSQAAQPQLEDGSVYRARWWAYFHGRQNYLRDVAKGSVNTRVLGLRGIPWQAGGTKEGYGGPAALFRLC